MSESLPNAVRTLPAQVEAPSPFVTEIHKIFGES